MKLNQLTGWILLTLTPFLLSVRSQSPDPAMRLVQAHKDRAGLRPPVLYHIPMAGSLQTMQQAVAAHTDSRPVADQAGGCLYKTGNIALAATNMVKE